MKMILYSRLLCLLPIWSRKGKVRWELIDNLLRNGKFASCHLSTDSISSVIGSEDLEQITLSLVHDHSKKQKIQKLSIFLFTFFSSHITTTYDYFMRIYLFFVYGAELADTIFWFLLFAECQKKVDFSLSSCEIYSIREFPRNVFRSKPKTILKRANLSFDLREFLENFYSRCLFFEV